jgi:ferredoxin--NADP+ reductase
VFDIVAKKEWHPTITEFWVKAPEVAKKHRPGQFMILRIHEEGERIPLTIAESDKDKGLIRIIFQKVGKTTYHLGTLNVGDALTDVVGPLGRPTDIKNVGTVVCVGGGVGIAPLFPIAYGMKESGNRLITILGARCKDLLIMEDDFRKVSDGLIITTDDGSYGRKGFVTHALEDLLKEDGDTVGEVVGIGPPIMMKFIVQVCEPFKVPLTVSLNSIMVDATGMCGACRVTVGGKTRFVCVDGPEFNGYEVDFEELMTRQSMYKDKEKLALEKFRKECPHAFEGEVQ